MRKVPQTFDTEKSRYSHSCQTVASIRRRPRPGERGVAAPTGPSGASDRKVGQSAGELLEGLADAPPAGVVALLGGRECLHLERSTIGKGEAERVVDRAVAVESGCLHAFPFKPVGLTGEPARFLH